MAGHTNRIFAKCIIQADSDFLVSLTRDVDNLPFYRILWVTSRLIKPGHTWTIGCPNPDGLKISTPDTSLLEEWMESTSNVSSFEVNIAIGEPGIGRSEFQWIGGYDIAAT